MRRAPARPAGGSARGASGSPVPAAGRAQPPIGLSIDVGMNPFAPLMVVTWEYFPRGISTTTFSPALQVMAGLAEASIGIDANIGQSAVTVCVMSDSFSAGPAAAAVTAGIVAAMASD